MSKKIKINFDITPENAHEHGYEWQQDTVYDEEAPSEAMQNIIDAINSGRYLLGSAASPHPNFCGMYKKIDK